MTSHTRAPFLATITLLLFLGSFPLYMHASNTSGWFHPIVENLGPVGSCGLNEALVDVALVEHSFYTEANPAGVSLRLRVVDKTTGALVEDTGTVTGDTVSPARCFNPAEHALLPTVGDSATYHKAGRVALSFRPSPTRPLLHGNHVRGYIHLLRKDVGSPNISHVYPGVLADDVNINTSTPTFQIWNHMITPTYDSTSATTTSVYVRNLVSGTLTSLGAFPTPTATGLSEMTPTTSLGDGLYQWFYHQELNGVARIDLSGTPVDFVGFPVSSLSDTVTFRVDTVKPTISVPSFPVYTRASDDSYVTTQVRVVVRDVASGLRTASLTVYDGGGNVVNFINVIYPGPAFTTAEQWVTTPSMQLNAGETYRIVANALDDAGNFYEREFFHTVTIPPLITLVTPHDVLTLNSVRLKAQVTAKGSSDIINRWICYRTINSDITTFGNCQLYVGGTVGEIFIRDVGPLTPGVYYYQTRAQNAENLFANSNVASFLIGEPGVGGCTVDTRCTGVGLLDSQIRVCHTTNSFATAYEVSFCEGTDPCPDPATRTPVSLGLISDFWHPNPGSHTYGERYHYYVRAQYATGWSGWTYLFNRQARDCTPLLTTPAVSSPTWSPPVPDGVGGWESTLGANVTTDGNAPILDRTTCWALNSNDFNLSFTSGNCESVGAGALGVFSNIRSGLPAGQWIYFRGCVQNSAGWNCTPVASFFTGVVTAPELEVPVVSNIRTNVATIFGTVLTAGGLPRVTHRVVDFCEGVACNFSSYYRCYDDPAPVSLFPNVFGNVNCMYRSNSSHVTSITTFRVRTCARNDYYGILGIGYACTYNTFTVDPDSITSEGGGAGTFLPQ